MDGVLLYLTIGLDDAFLVKVCVAQSQLRAQVLVAAGC